jgi:hypothetical protein
MAGGMVAIMLIAALVFDVGQNLLDRRNQQNVADAAALAGARFLTLPACKPVGGVQPACPEARAAAIDIATRNGYTDGVANHTVQVLIPPDNQSQFPHYPGHIEVVLGGTRGSFFTGVIGATTQRVSTIAVAGNIANYSLPFALLALDPHKCGALSITGNGIININADIQVNSDCTTSGALQVGGSGATVNAASATCYATGTIKVNSGTLTCNEQEHASPQVFPAIAGPAVQPTPAAPTLIGGITGVPQRNKWTIGDGCPGQGPTSATIAAPQICKIQSTKPNPSGVHLFPGTYPGGIWLTQASGDGQLSVYMEPGIYYIAGGGLEVDGDIVLRSVEAGGTIFDPASPTMGVMIYNTDNPQTHTGISTMDFQTGSLSDVDLRGDQIDAAFKGLLLFQDAKASSQPAVKMTGHSAQSFIGTIYIPGAQFAYAGTSSGEVLQAQIIANDFAVNGNGVLNINYDAAAVYQFKGVGLVQ